jgi:hypothetical protein
MPEDKRETILARLAEVAATVFPPANVLRNSLQLPEKARPACVILDADEEADGEAATVRNAPARAPAIIRMAPEIHILIGDEPGDVGTALNDYRRKLIAAITGDGSLVAACFNGDIRFESFATGLSAGRQMESQGLLVMGFRYMLRPERLAP